MKLASFTSFLWLIVREVWANPADNAASEATAPSPSSSIEIVIPNRSYLLKLDCISCPYLVRHSDRTEWEKDPRPNQLTLKLYVDRRSPKSYPPGLPYNLPGLRLYLQGEEFDPFWPEMHSVATPNFTANQTGTNETLQREENGIGYGMPIRQFELAYDCNVIRYTPGPYDRVPEWQVLIQFDITGLRHEEHEPKDIPFFGSKDGKRVEGTVPGVTSVIRLVLGYTDSKEMIITALELMPKDGMAQFASEEIEALHETAGLKGAKSITTADWGGRLRDINGPDGEHMYSKNVSFKREYRNDCGGTDDRGRLKLCNWDDYVEYFSFLDKLIGAFVVSCCLSIPLTALCLCCCYDRDQRRRSCWKFAKAIDAEGENDASSLVKDEDLEKEGEK